MGCRSLGRVTGGGRGEERGVGGCYRHAPTHIATSCSVERDGGRALSAEVFCGASGCGRPPLVLQAHSQPPDLCHLPQDGGKSPVWGRLTAGAL